MVLMETITSELKVLSARHNNQTGDFASDVELDL
jgi:hypothetical protein